jgi:hypothetical protein
MRLPCRPVNSSHPQATRAISMQIPEMARMVRTGLNEAATIGVGKVFNHDHSRGMIRIMTRRFKNYLLVFGISLMMWALLIGLWIYLW